MPDLRDDTTDEDWKAPPRASRIVRLRAWFRETITPILFVSVFGIFAVTLVWAAYNEATTPAPKLVPVQWTPITPPRSDLACWESMYPTGRIAVCAPERTP